MLTRDGFVRIDRYSFRKRVLMFSGKLLENRAKVMTRYPMRQRYIVWKIIGIQSLWINYCLISIDLRKRGLLKRLVALPDGLRGSFMSIELFDMRHGIVQTAGISFRSIEAESIQ
jgi:hypothetical protein